MKPIYILCAQHSGLHYLLALQIGAAIDDSLAEPFVHSYSLTGSFTSGHFQEMRIVHSGMWEGTFRLGVSGEEDFQIARAPRTSGFRVVVCCKLCKLFFAARGLFVQLVFRFICGLSRMVM